MKAAIHPKYFDAVEIRCSCGNVIITGSTQQKLKTELCSKCHPFYTGQQKLVDTAGRVDKFEALRVRAKKLQEETKLKAAAKKKKPEVYKEKEVAPEVIARAMEGGKWGAPLGDSLSREVVKEEIAEAVKAEKAEKKVKKAPVKKAAVRKTIAKKK